MLTMSAHTETVYCGLNNSDILYCLITFSILMKNNQSLLIARYCIQL